MANHFRLYGRPLMADEVLPPLMVTGALADFVPGDQYEGRLQIVNSIGRCTVEVVDANLPPGYSVRVDNVTKQVVVKWDAYEEVVDELNSVPNGDFEQGDNGQWSFGNGWSIQSGGAETGTFSGVFQNFRGIASIESVRVPYTPGTPIRAQCRFQQGASSKGNLVGRIILIWCDANGNMLPGGEGTSFVGGTLIRSGSNGQWQTSEVTAANREAATVAVGFSANRKKQNKLARVDNFTWNHKYTLGTDKQEDYFLKIKVTDSANRVAYWEGTLWYKSYWLSTPVYPQYHRDDLTIEPFFVEAASREGVVTAELLPDSASIEPFFVGAGTRSTFRTYSATPEGINIAPFFTGAVTRMTQLSTTQPPEGINIAPFFTGAVTVDILVTTSGVPDAMAVTPFFTGASTQ